MENSNTLLLHEFYVKFAETISGLRFTHREIDVIACVLHNRGSSIPSFLNITPRTIETHKRHIMQKIRCNSREGIIDFIEQSGKHDIIKQYYSMLITRHSFEKCLKRIAEMRIKKYPVHLIVNCNSVLYKSSLVQAIVKDSQLAGIHIYLHLHELYSEGELTTQNVIVMSAERARPFVSLNSTLSEDQLKAAYVMCDEADNAIVLLEQNEAFCFHKDENTQFYDIFISFLERLISDVDLTLVFQAFKQRLQKRLFVFNAASILSDKTLCKKSACFFTCNPFVTVCKNGKKKMFAATLLILLGVYVVYVFFLRNEDAAFGIQFAKELSSLK